MVPADLADLPLACVALRVTTAEDLLLALFRRHSAQKQVVAVAQGEQVSPVVLGVPIGCTVLRRGGVEGTIIPGGQERADLYVSSFTKKCGVTDGAGL